MINDCITTTTLLPANNSPVSFPAEAVRTRSASCNCWLQHNCASPLYKLLKGGVYEVELTATLTSATAGIVALGLYEDGVLLPCTVGAETLAAAGDLANIAIHRLIRVCCNGDTTISVASIPSVLAGADGATATATQIPIITSASFSIKKLA